jgi:hypothetical protein
VAVAGLIAGTLDILATGIKVVGFGPTTATRLLQSIASGLLGPAAFDGGLPVAALGAVLHFTIATTWAAVFAMAARRVAPVGRIRSTAGQIGVGLGYGALVWLVMDFVVLALSRARSVSPASPGFWVQLAIHMGCVGLPIALIVGPRGQPA